MDQPTSSHTSAALDSPPATWAAPLLALDPRNLPPLPPIADRALERLAFTHKSAVASHNDSRSDTYLAELRSNERLEWEGDALLKCCISTNLIRQLPSATAGFLTTVRNRLDSNATFSHLAWHYGLPRRLNSGRRPGHGFDLDQKMAANTFEAYLGASCRSRRLEALKTGIEQSLASWKGEQSQRRRRLEDVVPEMDDQRANRDNRPTFSVTPTHRWDEEFVPGIACWESRLSRPGFPVATGRATSKPKARDAALTAFFQQSEP